MTGRRLASPPNGPVGHPAAPQTAGMASAPTTRAQTGRRQRAGQRVRQASARKSSAPFRFSTIGLAARSGCPSKAEIGKAADRVRRDKMARGAGHRSTRGSRPAAGRRTNSGQSTVLHAASASRNCDGLGHGTPIMYSAAQRSRPSTALRYDSGAPRTRSGSRPEARMISAEQG